VPWIGFEPTFTSLKGSSPSPLEDHGIVEQTRFERVTPTPPAWCAARLRYCSMGPAAGVEPATARVRTG
jgi:hypothetical protein